MSNTKVSHNADMMKCLTNYDSPVIISIKMIKVRAYGTLEEIVRNISE